MLIDDIDIQRKIYTVRGLQVMIDSDLAVCYGVETKNLNKAVKRNIERFPDNFRFQLSETEYADLRFQTGTSNEDNFLNSQNQTSKSMKGGRRYLPYVFTEQGVSMLSAVLRSETAIQVSIKIINSFVHLRKFLIENGDIFKKIDTLEKRQISFEIKTDSKIDSILNAIDNRNIKPKQGIFYNGQIFDAYVFVSNLIKQAEKSIILIDNYIDENVLILLSKRNVNCSVEIYTKKITDRLKLDLEKYNAQYPEIVIKEFKISHDRFLIIDKVDLYHIGASLKDLGNKIFAFSKMDKENLKIIDKLKI